MFAYLSKKISIPNNVNVVSICWDQGDGYIACGCEGNLLKVLKLEPSAGNEPRLRGLAAPSNLSTNQTLDGHTGTVRVVVWNEKAKRLTSSDENGLIIVWQVYKGALYEEMINNRGKALVRDMRWNHTGDKICIAYEDGTVIVGSVDGHRIWSKDLSMTLKHCEWSPNGRLLLFASADGIPYIFDNQGNRVGQGSIGMEKAPGELVTIDWFPGRPAESDSPTLALVYRTILILLRSPTDPAPIIVDMAMKATWARWSPDGRLLAITGQQQMHDSEKDRMRDFNVVHFYNSLGMYHRSIKLPGRSVSSCSWESTGLRLALAIDSYIYFANIRPDYKWAYCGNTLVYAYTSKTAAEEQFVMFMNLRKNTRQIRPVRQLCRMTGAGEFCCLACRSDDASAQYALFLCNALGISMDTRYVDVEPLLLTMTKNVIVCASKEAFYIWQYVDPNRILLLERMTSASEKLYHVDDTPSGAAVDAIDPSKIYKPTNDPICAIGASETLLLIGRNSGAVNVYDLPQVILVDKISLPVRPQRFVINSTNTKIAVLDSNGVLLFYNLEKKAIEAMPPQVGAAGDAKEEKQNVNDKKDVWDMAFAEDNSAMFACLEKTKLCVLREGKFEEPVLTSGFICSFCDLQVKVAMLDEILRNPEDPNPEYVLTIESKVLRDARELLKKGSLADVEKFAEVNSHAKVWKLLAEAALEQMNMKVAEHAFVRSHDYSGIKFVQNLSRLQNDRLRKAEVEAYFERFDNSEQLFRSADRLDLAISLRKKLGDWNRVVTLLKADSGGANDRETETALTALGEHHAERQQWLQAVSYLHQAKTAMPSLIHCHFMLEDYDSLEAAAASLPDNDRLLSEVAQMFLGVGLCDQTVACYLRAGQVRDAVDACIQLNAWSRAVQLAEQYGLSDVPAALTKMAHQMINEQGRIISAIELFRRADRFLDAGKLLFRIADKLASVGSAPMLLKKIYVLAALLVERHHDHLKQQQRKGSTPAMPTLSLTKSSKGGQDMSRWSTRTLSVVSRSSIDPAASLAGLLAEDATSVPGGMGASGGSTGSVLEVPGDSRLVDNAWRGAEAYHLLLLTHRHLYAGRYDAAHRTSVLLADYEDFLGPCRVASLQALCAAACRNFASCSSAFLRLESLTDAKDIEPGHRQQLEELAVEIFSRRSPVDAHATTVACPSCNTLIPDWCAICPHCSTKYPICIVSGRPLFQFQFWMCGTCKHRASETEIRQCQFCPLCHAAI